MKRLPLMIIVIVANFLLVFADESGESDSLISSSAIELKRISRPSGGTSRSNSATREQAAAEDHEHDILDTFESIAKQSVVPSDSSASANGILGEAKKITLKKSGHSSSKLGGYGYPHRMAPTLPPFDKHVSDRQDDESEPEYISSSEERIPQLPHLPAEDSDESLLPKQTDTLKKRQGSDYNGGDSAESREYSPVSFDYSSYKEPNYRNLYDLDEYSPRRMYYESSGPYSRPSFNFPSPKPRPIVSPRDPYLSPSDEPIDGFYPKVKNNGFSTSYSTYGKRNKYYNTISSPAVPPSRGYHLNDDFSDFSSEEEGFGLGQGGYAKSPKYGSGPRPYSEPDPYSGPPPKGPSGSGGRNYENLYNSPIIGITRKRLLDYAGASDLYQGEPDYLKSAAIRKTKFSSIEHDYSPYRRSDVYSFTDYHFDESRSLPSRPKREAEYVPICAKNTSLSFCLTDEEYPTDDVKKVVSKSIKFLSQLKNTRLELNQKKPISVPESVEDLKKTQSVCSSKKGNVYPKRAQDVDGIWRTVVNVDVAQQSIEVDVCRSADSPCDYVPSAILTKCVQRFALITLVTYNDKDTVLEHHDFTVPSACGCSVGWPVRVRLE